MHGTDDIADAIRECTARSRGYADYDSGSHSSVVRDHAIACDFREALVATCGELLPQLRAVEVGSDPPDLVGDGIGVDLTELVDQAAVREAVRQRRAGGQPTVNRRSTGLGLSPDYSPG